MNAFALSVSLDSPYIVLIDVNITFAMDRDKINLPIAEVLFCAAVDNLAKVQEAEVLDTTQHHPSTTILDGGGSL